MQTANTEPAWQCGYPLETLKDMTLPFRQAHDHLCFGAFEGVKERDVAQALRDGRFLGIPGEAAAIWRYTKQPGRGTDFTGRQYTVPAGVMSVSALAAVGRDAAAGLLGRLVAMAGDHDMWVEAFLEDSPIIAALHEWGFTWLTTKIKAGSELKGLYVSPGAASPTVLAQGRPSVVDMVTLAILQRDWLSADDHGRILGELLVAEERWAQHYSSYNKGRAWDAFALQGYDADPGFIIKPAEMSKGWKAANADKLPASPQPTAAVVDFPHTMAIAQRLMPAQRVRFMRLRAGGQLTRHADITDREAGTQDGAIARLHVPLITNPDVHFYGWTAHGAMLDRNLPERSLCYLDQRKPHAVRNDGDQDRIHLVIDCIATPELRRFLVAHEPD